MKEDANKQDFENLKIDLREYLPHRIYQSITINDATDNE